MRNKIGMGHDRQDKSLSLLEKQVEQALVKAVRKRGGIAMKFVSPAYDGMPDRIVLIPDGHFAFVEVKAPGKKPRSLQLSRHRLLRQLGFQVYVLDSVEKVGDILKAIGGKEA